MESLLASLPEWARGVFYILAAAGAAVLFLIGRSRPAPSSTAGSGDGFRVNMAMVDNRAVERLYEEVSQQTDAIRDQARSMDSLNRSITDLATQIARRS